MEFQTLNTTDTEDTEDTVALFSFEDGIEERRDLFPRPSGPCCDYVFYRVFQSSALMYDTDE